MMVVKVKERGEGIDEPKTNKTKEREKKDGNNQWPLKKRLTPAAIIALMTELLEF